MVRLSEADLRAALDAVHRIHEVVERAEFGPLAIDVVGSVVESQATAYNEVDPEAGVAVAIMEPADVDIAEGLEILGRLATEHPLIRHYAETADGSALMISDFWTIEEFHASALYRELYRGLGVEHQMAMTLPSPRPTVVAMTVGRDRVDRPFTERDRAMLELLRPHLAQAHRFSAERARLRALASAASTALAASGTAAVLLTDPPSDLTPGACVQLYRYFGRPGPTDPLPPRVRTWADRQRRRLAATDLGRPEPLRPLIAHRDGTQVVARYLPSDPADVVVLDERPVAAPRSMVAWGLTPREDEVLAELVAGAPIDQIARRLGMAPGTAKKHLEHVYRKLGVRSRAEAVALVLAAGR